MKHIFHLLMMGWFNLFFMLNMIGLIRHNRKTYPTFTLVNLVHKTGYRRPSFFCCQFFQSWRI
jgi:hypothetical protein